MAFVPLPDHIEGVPQTVVQSLNDIGERMVVLTNNLMQSSARLESAVARMCKDMNQAIPVNTAVDVSDFGIVDIINVHLEALERVADDIQMSLNKLG